MDKVYLKFNRWVLINEITCRRFFSSQSNTKVGQVVGVYKDDSSSLTTAAGKMDAESSGQLSSLLNYGGPLKEGKCRIFYGLEKSSPIVAAVGLGKKNYNSDPLEERNEGKEAVRTAIAAGCRALKDLSVEKIIVDPCGDSEAAAEGAHLSLFTYDDLKSKKTPLPEISTHQVSDEWKKGTILGSSQNIARRLMEMPGNILTPTQFAQEAVSHLENLGVEVLVRTQEWAKERGMNAFLSVSKGSIEPPIFVELSYRGAQQDSKPLAIVGKGVTFDAGGISLKPPAKMEAMRADMGGAACTVGAIHAIASLGLPINVKGFIPLCENLPSGSANKPGDVVVASNGKTIQIDNTDAEGRLILADALVYASQHNPCAIVNMATLTGAMMVALGACASGAFTNSSSMWQMMHKAGHHTGDRVWRMPAWKYFTKQVTDFGYADVHNLGKHQRQGGASLATAFLQQFISCDHWMHLDIAGVMENSDEVPYLGKGMSGRPTRTVAQFASLLSASAL